MRRNIMYLISERTLKLCLIATPFFLYNTRLSLLSTNGCLVNHFVDLRKNQDGAKLQQWLSVIYWTFKTVEWVCFDCFGLSLIFFLILRIWKNNFVWQQAENSPIPLNPNQHRLLITALCLPVLLFLTYRTYQKASELSSYTNRFTNAIARTYRSSPTYESLTQPTLLKHMARWRHTEN